MRAWTRIGSNGARVARAKRYTPNGRSIQGVGIAPDLVLRPEGDAGSAPRVSEAGLRGHLRGEEEGDAMAGENAGDVLPGEAPLNAALTELKRIAGDASAKLPIPAAKPTLPKQPSVPPPGK